MPILITRRLNEAVRIGPAVEVRIVEIGDGAVGLSITAPREIPVHRDEIFLAVQEANRRAAATRPDAVALAERRLSRNGEGHVTGSVPGTPPA